MQDTRYQIDKNNLRQGDWSNHYIGARTYTKISYMNGDVTGYLEWVDRGTLIEKTYYAR